MSNDTGFSTEFKGALVAAVGVTCVLSILGSGTIIFSFVLFRELRTTMRYILLQLSIADLIVALTNLFGAFESLKHLIREEEVDDADRGTLCVTQAAIGLFGTDASILLTIIFISYVFFLVTCYRPKRISNIAVLTLLTLFAWVFPLVLVSVFAGKKYFGYKPEYSPEFCSIYTESNNLTELAKQVVGYEMFLFVSFLALPILSAAFVCHICYMQRRHSLYIKTIEQFSMIKSAELKLIFVPVVFMVIRVWGLILDIYTYVLKLNHGSPNDGILAIVFLTGIGDSAQGFVNGLFFTLLTPSVRYRLSSVCLKCLCCCCTKHESYGPITSSVSYRSTSISSRLEEHAKGVQESDYLIPKPEKYSIIFSHDN